MYKRMIEAMKRFTRRHIVDTFPHDEECWACNKGNCEGCPVVINVER